MGQSFGRNKATVQSRSIGAVQVFGNEFLAVVLQSHMTSRNLVVVKANLTPGAATDDDFFVGLQLVTSSPIGTVNDQQRRARHINTSTRACSPLRGVASRPRSNCQSQLPLVAKKEMHIPRASGRQRLKREKFSCRGLSGVIGWQTHRSREDTKFVSPFYQDA